jgi:hypothetical protein
MLWFGNTLNWASMLSLAKCSGGGILWFSTTLNWASMLGLTRCFAEAEHDLVQQYLELGLHAKLGQVLWWRLNMLWFSNTLNWASMLSLARCSGGG